MRPLYDAVWHILCDRLRSWPIIPLFRRPLRSGRRFRKELLMKYRRLGKTNLKVSVIGMGTWQFGGEWGKTFSQDEATAMIAKARELGINLIDTAECYGDHTSESLIGGAIAGGSVGQREDWIIATKFGHIFTGHLQRIDEPTPAAIMRQLEGSLKALRTDYIDLYQYHSVRDSEFDTPELRAVLDKAVRNGKVRHIGNSISNNPATTDGGYQVERSPEAHVEAIQLVYNRLERRPEETIFPICQRPSLGLLAREPP